VTTTSTPTDEDRRQFVRYTQTRHWPMLQRFPVAADLHDELLAQMMACTPETAREIIDVLAAETRDTAEEMLADCRYGAAIRALPFRPGDRIVAVGDSITADRLGWFELLSASVLLAGTATGTMVNLGVSGNTTADVLERFDRLESARPSHVLLMLGTNDVRSHGRATGYRMVTASETARNMRALVDLIVNGLGAAITVITPPAVDQPRIDAFFADAPVHWRAADIAEVAAVVREVDPGGLDLHRLTRLHPNGDILEADGVHPTPAGQRLILTHVVDHLVAAAPS
jgi:acyl-CoA thioesterase I